MDDKVRNTRANSAPQSSDALPQMLLEISGRLSCYTAEQYFQALVASLSRGLGMEHVFVGELLPGNPRLIQTRAAYANGKLVDNFQYDLADSPCENVLKRRSACYANNIQNAFPKDRLLQEMSIESYIGASLLSSAGTSMGILVACSSAAMQNETAVKACFDLVVSRTAAELERMQTDEKVHGLLQLIDQCPLSIAITDTRRQLVHINKQFETATGYSKQEVLGKEPSFLTSGESFEPLYDEIWQTIGSGHIWKGELSNRHKNGSHIWSHATFAALKNANDDITGYISIKEEIGRQKENEKQLRLAASVFQTAAEALIVTDKDHTIQMVNDAFCKITGYTRAEVIGQKPSILQSGRHGKPFYEAMFDSLRDKQAWAGEIWNRRKNGEIYPEWLSITALQDDAGNLEGYAALFIDITKRKQHESLIQHQANYDALTGLANKNLLQTRLSRALTNAKAADQRVALLFVDLDGFKHLNDALGHSTGDLLLQEVANRLTRRIKTPNTLARFGGDEFVVLLSEHLSLAEIGDTAASILASLTRPFMLEGYKRFISASIGVAVYPEDGDNAEALLRKADNAMYKAKSRGRNNFQFFTLEMDIEAQERQELEQSLREAIDKQQLTLAYQPVIDLDSGRPVGAETLVRWQHPDKGFISPERFIPLAEEVGLIAPLGEWILREACQAAAAWPAVDNTPLTVAVNLSSIQFKQQNIPALVAQVLAETGLAAERLALEITEGLLVADDDNTLAQLQRIRQLGVGLSIDDFGTGYSSLSYLKKFPVNALKIDRSFIMELENNAENQALVSAILYMAQALDLKVIAEGVETADQAEFLRLKYCQFVQGYHYSRPLPKDVFLDYIKALS